MSLTRREFVMASASGLSLFSFTANARCDYFTFHTDSLRHAHLELPSGPYTRATLAHIVSRAADAAGLSAPESATALGVTLQTDPFPATFVLTCIYPGDLRLNVRASNIHQGSPELTLRGQRSDLDLHYSIESDDFQPVSSLS